MKTQHKNLCVGLGSVVLVCFAGCGTSPAPDSVKTQDWGVIEAAQLADQSVSEPVNVAQATEQVVQGLADSNESPLSMALTLAEVRAATLANNLDLKLDRIDPAMAQKSLSAEAAKFDSTLSGSAGADYTEAVGTGATSAAWFSQIGASKPLRTGGTLQLSLPVSDSDHGGLASASASVTVIQSLLRGAGTSLNAQSIRIAETQWQMASARTKLNAIAWLANADVAYWRLFAANKDLAVRREQYKLAEDQLNHAQKKVAAGSAARIEIVRAEAGVASRLESVINAETRVDYYARNLRRIMNLPDVPVDASVSMVLETEPYPLGLDLDETALFAQALTNRMDMAELEMSMVIDGLDVDYARNAALPEVDVRYSYASHTQGASVHHAINRFSGRAYDDHAISVAAVIPVGNRAAKARLQRARLSQLQGQLLKKRLRQVIQQDVAEAVSQLNSNWRRILAAEQGVIAAERDYLVDQSQFKLGRRNSTDVLYSATRLGDAQLGRIRAFVDYEIAQITLARVTGTLLGKDRVELSEISTQ
ncbi:MAG: TolC family protein [Planctomycetes bacterium]|nr:TolC family protein [Planctomycetota bacterium]